MNTDPTLDQREAPGGRPDGPQEQPQAGGHQRVWSRMWGRLMGWGLSLCLPPDPQFADGVLANQLALLLLERCDSLYQVPQYEARVHRWALLPAPRGVTPHPRRPRPISPPLALAAMALSPTSPALCPFPAALCSLCPAPQHHLGPAAAHTPLPGPECPRLRSSSPRSIISSAGPSSSP